MTYHVEVAGQPCALPPYTGEPLLPHALRAPWADAAGLRELLDWATAALGRPVTGPIEQHRTWNLAGLFRLPTAEGPVWLKATPRFATDEAAVIAAFAPAGPADRRPATIADHAAELLDRLGDELTAEERSATESLLPKLSTVDDCGLPTTLVHGDFHAGNWRSADGDPVILDFADAHLGNPVLDGLRLCDFLPAARRPAATRAWVSAWRAERQDSDPARALAIAEPYAHLSYAVRYQEFLDGIEPSERIYHAGDPVSEIRAALRSASSD